MCTRFYVEPDNEETQDIIEEAIQSKLRWAFLRAGSKILTSGEIRPTNVVPVIATRRDGKKAAFPMRWGFQIPGRSLLVNARTETAAEKPSFRESWQIHRCIIPASWYFEWEHLMGNSGQKKTGDKFMIQPLGYTMTYLAGLYRMEEGLPVFTVLTRDPQEEELRRIHDRMPLIFPPEKISDWINPQIRPESLLPYALTKMETVRVQETEKEK